MTILSHCTSFGHSREQTPHTHVHSHRRVIVVCGCKRDKPRYLLSSENNTLNSSIINFTRFVRTYEAGASTTCFESILLNYFYFAFSCCPRAWARIIINDSVATTASDKWLERNISVNVNMHWIDGQQIEWKISFVYTLHARTQLHCNHCGCGADDRYRPTGSKRHFGSYKEVTPNRISFLINLLIT